MHLTLKKSFLLLTFLQVVFVYAQMCPDPEIILFEDFEEEMIEGPVLENIFGIGIWDNNNYILSGDQHGWLNAQNGFSDVDLYDRTIGGVCPGEEINVSFYTRKSSGDVNASYSCIDEDGIVLEEIVLDVSNTFQLFEFTFTTTTPTFRFVIHLNSEGGPGADIVIEDILVTSCFTNAYDLNIITTDATCDLADDALLEIISDEVISASSDGGITWQDDLEFTNLLPGIYEVCVVGECGIENCQEVEILAGEITLETENDLTECYGNQAELSAIGAGGENFIYHWDFTDETSEVVLSEVINTSAEANVFVENEFGCTSNIEQIFIEVILPFDTLITACNSDAPLSLNDIVSEDAFGISWSESSANLSNQFNPALGAFTLEDLDQDDYTFDYTLTNSACPDLEHHLVVNVISTPETSFTQNLFSSCDPLNVTFTNTSEFEAETNFFWDFGNGDVSSSNVTATTNFIDAECYTVSLTADNQGCVSSLNLEDAVCVFPSPVAEFSLSQNTIFSFNPLLSLENFSTGAVEYLWDFGDGNSSSEQNPIHTFDEALLGAFDINLLVINEYGCRDSISNLVTIDELGSLYVPSAFTPDGDNLNNVFRVISEDEPLDYELFIFNRWGEVVFHSLDINEAWTGNFESGDYFVPNAIYTYQLTYALVPTLKIEKTGFITVVR